MLFLRYLCKMVDGGVDVGFVFFFGVFFMCFHCDMIHDGVNVCVVIRRMVSTFCFRTTVMWTVCGRWCRYLFHGVWLLLLYYDKVDGLSTVVRHRSPSKAAVFLVNSCDLW